MGDIHNSRVNIGPELDNNGFCFDMANNYYQLAKCRRIQKNSTHFVLLKEYICNTGERKASVCFSAGTLGVFLVYSGSTFELYANFRKAIKRSAPARMNRGAPLKCCFY